MKPIYPFLIEENSLKDGSWLSNPEFAAQILHIRNVCVKYPSLILGYSADMNAKANALAFIDGIAQKLGINVFYQDDPVPLPALSYAITVRSMPLGIYIEDYVHNNNQAMKVTLLSTHGGLFDEQDLHTEFVKTPEKSGVIGTTDILSSYVKQLAGFADPYVNNGLCFADISIPFDALKNKLSANDNLNILFERDLKGPVAKLSNNGCYVNIFYKNELFSTEKLSLILANYLKNERFTSGTCFVEKGSSQIFSTFGELTEIEGNHYDLSYQAAFSDLFIGWWKDEMIALQGSSCFGDGLLSALYYLESQR